MTCKTCNKLRERIKEIYQQNKKNYKYQREKDKELKYLIAETLRILYLQDMRTQEIREKLKKFGGVKQYHNYK